MNIISNCPLPPRDLHRPRIRIAVAATILRLFSGGAQIFAVGLWPFTLKAQTGKLAAGESQAEASKHWSVRRSAYPPYPLVAGERQSDASKHPAFRFEKQNRVVLPNGKAGEFDQLEAKYPCVLKVNEEWWMWYSARRANPKNGTGKTIGLAKSRDGLEWVKCQEAQPVLDYSSPDSDVSDHPAVLHFGGKFHLWFSTGPGTAGDSTGGSIGYATSLDGIRWTWANEGKAVLGASVDGSRAFHPTVARVEEGRLHLWFVTADFHLGHATSEDGIHWTRSNGGKPVLSPSTVDGFVEASTYNVMVLYDQRTFHMWYGSRGKNPQTGTDCCITHASSKDGINWQRDETQTLFVTALGGCVVRRPEGLWMYHRDYGLGQGDPTWLAICKLEGKNE